MTDRPTGLRILVAVVDDRRQPVARLFARMHGISPGNLANHEGGGETRHPEAHRCHDAPRLHARCRRHEDVAAGQILIFGANRFTIDAVSDADDGEMELLCTRIGKPTLERSGKSEDGSQKGGGDVDVPVGH